MSSPDATKPEGLRASDHDRERHAVLLREHAAEGRLTMEELSERLEGAYSARTLDELAELLHDLPEVEPAIQRTEEARGQRRDLRGHVTTFVVVNLLLIGIWAATGAGYFWPVWPLLGWGAVLAVHAAVALTRGPITEADVARG